jgi:hypothetical protein
MPAHTLVLKLLTCIGQLSLSSPLKCDGVRVKGSVTYLTDEEKVVLHLHCSQSRLGTDAL